MESKEILNINQKIDEYKNKLQKVETAVQANSLSPERLKELSQLKDDLHKAIQYHQDLLKVSNERLQSYFSSFKLTKSDEGRKCNAYAQEDKNWYPAHINRVNSENNTAEVTFLGYKTTRVLPFSYTQVLVPPEELYEGQYVDALLEDGKWHPSTVELVKDSVTVRLSRWGHQHTLPFDCIKLNSNSKKRPLVERDVLEIPESMKILPNDPENVRNKKKRKLKALKKDWKQRQMQKESQEYVSHWKAFKQKKLKGLKKQSQFKSPETIEGKIGVSNSGKGPSAPVKRVKYTDYFNQFAQ